MLNIAHAIAIAFFVGCGDEPASTGPSSAGPVAASDEPPPPPADVDVELPVLPEGDVYAVDPDSSKIEFTGSQVTGSQDGSFQSFSGSVVLADDEAIGTKFIIDIATTTSGHEKLTEHLLSKDFFHAEKYPTATFVSSELIAAGGSGAVTHDVKGVLELHGKTRPLSFPATVIVGAMATTVEASFDINRQNWGVSYPGKPDNLIEDDVQIRLSLRFPTTDAGSEAPATQ